MSTIVRKSNCYCSFDFLYYGCFFCCCCIFLMVLLLRLLLLLYYNFFCRCCCFAECFAGMLLLLLLLLCRVSTISYLEDRNSWEGVESRWARQKRKTKNRNNKNRGKSKWPNIVWFQLRSEPEVQVFFEWWPEWNVARLAIYVERLCRGEVPKRSKVREGRKRVLLCLD